MSGYTVPLQLQMTPRQFVRAISRARALANNRLTSQSHVTRLISGLNTTISDPRTRPRSHLKLSRTFQVTPKPPIAHLLQVWAYLKNSLKCQQHFLRQSASPKHGVGQSLGRCPFAIHVLGYPRTVAKKGRGTSRKGQNWATRQPPAWTLLVMPLCR